MRYRVLNGQFRLGIEFRMKAETTDSAGNSA
jgi:hypothetical protein